MWHKFSRSDDDKFGDYPPEGVDVVVTDGKSIDVAYYVYSGSQWVKFDEKRDDKGNKCRWSLASLTKNCKLVQMTISPTHWMWEEDWTILERDKIIDKLLQ